MTKKLELNDSKNNSQANEEELDITHIYTKLSEAKEEVWRRWNDKELRKKVEEFLGDEMPDVFKDSPKAMLFRFLLTPNLEARYFLDLVDDIEIKPVYGEFLNDRFCTRNQDKLHLGKMKFLLNREMGENKEISCKKVIDIERNENKPIGEIKTIWNEKLVEFHHRIFFDKHKIETFDVSRFKTNGESAIDVYEKMFALFVCHGVLCENYIAKKDHYEFKFVNNVIMPAIERTLERFGKSPLIMPLLPLREEPDRTWMYYTQDISAYISER